MKVQSEDGEKKKIKGKERRESTVKSWRENRKHSREKRENIER